MKIELSLNDEESEMFEKALDDYSRIVRRKVSKIEFAKFAMLWFVYGFERDDVGDTQEDVLRNAKN